MDGMEFSSPPEFFFRIIVCINLLKGCLIFFIFVCKDSTREKVNIIYIKLFNFNCALQLGVLCVCGIKLSFLAKSNTASKVTVTVQEDDINRSLI